MQEFKPYSIDINNPSVHEILIRGIHLVSNQNVNNVIPCGEVLKLIQGAALKSGNIQQKEPDGKQN